MVKMKPKKTYHTHKIDALDNNATYSRWHHVMWCTKTKRRYKSLLVVQCTTNPNRQLFHRLFTFIHSTDTLHTLTKWKCAWFWMPLFIFLSQWFSNKQTRMRLLFTTQTHKDSIQTYNGFVFDMSSFCGKNNKTAHKMPHKHTNRWLFKNANKVHSRIFFRLNVGRKSKTWMIRL